MTLAQANPQQCSATAPTPAVSIIIPAYNVASFISETLDSVLQQSFTSWEAIVVNDGSADTAELELALAPYLDRITYFAQPNKGAGAARNAAIARARGEWLAFLDGDDYWAPNYLERQLRELQDHQLDMVWCDAIVVGDGALKDKRLTELSHSGGPPTLERVIMGRLTIPNSATVVRRSCVSAVGGIDETIRRGQDFDLWVRLLVNRTKAGYHEEPLLRYRVRENSLTGDAVSILDREIGVLKILAGKKILSSEALVAVQQRIDELESAKDVTLGKRRLAARDYAGSLAHFRAANKLRPSTKLRGIVLLFPLLAPLMRRYFIARTPEDLR